MEGPQILAASLSKAVPTGTSKTLWQYHSQSDRHGKVSSWAALFDLMMSCSLLRQHVEDGELIFGVNQRMVDFHTGRSKKLDLVVGKPAGASKRTLRTFLSLADEYSRNCGLVLTRQQWDKLRSLPPLSEGLVGSVLIALEAKATMTAHVKARPRLYDELNSSHLTVHGASERALALGLVVINSSETFISTKRNQLGGPTILSRHKQPEDTERTIQKVKEIRRRTHTGEHGFDGMAVIVISMNNDGSPVRLVTNPPAPQTGSLFDYDAMITRTSTEYANTFHRL